MPLDPESAADKEAAERYIDYRLGIFADPLYFGDWPESVKARRAGSRCWWGGAEGTGCAAQPVPWGCRAPCTPVLTPSASPNFHLQKRIPASVLPAISPSLKADLLAHKPDAFFLNHYTSKVIAEKKGETGGYGEGPTDYVEGYKFANGTAIGKVADSSWLYVYPQARRSEVTGVGSGTATRARALCGQAQTHAQPFNPRPALQPTPHAHVNPLNTFCRAFASCSTM